MTQTTEVATKNNALLVALNDKSMQRSIKMALPGGGLTPQRFTRIIMTECRKNADLLKCTKESFMAAILNAAACGLEIGVQGEAYLIPYGTECTFQTGYQGVIKMMRNTGEVGGIHAEIIYSVDDFEYTLGETPTLKHVPPPLASNEHGNRNPTSAIGAYAVVTLNSGEKLIKVMSEQEIMKYKARSMAATRSKKKNFWNHADDWEWMWKKTVIRQCSKLAPKSATRLVDASEGDWDMDALLDSPEASQSNDAIDVNAEEVDAANTPTTTPDEAAESEQKPPPRKGEVTAENAHLQR